MKEQTELILHFVYLMLTIIGEILEIMHAVTSKHKHMYLFQLHLSWKFYVKKSRNISNAPFWNFNTTKNSHSPNNIK